jgi:hypothetical protein
MDPKNDPYLVLLRRELTRAQARLRRAERERDALRDALAKLQSRPNKPAKRPSKTKDGRTRASK